jgi:hypothetical protein
MRQLITSFPRDVHHGQFLRIDDGNILIASDDQR